jgi:iron-sulfur cluster assembly protein
MITITKIAAIKIKNQLQRRGKGLGIKVGVKTTGCSGLAYVLEYVDTPKIDDECFQSQGCNIFVDAKSLVYIDGMIVDYTRKGLNEGFDFINTLEKDRCGCGESFRI